MELNRMAFDSVLPRNSESRAIAMSIRLLKKYALQVKWLISFAAACSCGDGIIYRAANFVLTGIKPNEALCILPDGTRLQARDEFFRLMADNGFESTGTADYDGNVIHYGYIEEFIEELGTKYNIREIAFDRWGAVQMTQNLEGLGFTVVPFGQGYKDMSPPTKELLKLTLEGKLAHGGHPVLRWMVDNVTIRSDPAGNIKADKEKSTEKIDGAIATIMALDRAIRHEGDGASVYDERGLLFI